MNNQNEALQISVIMPVYCSENYLEHAVQSVLAQDFPSFELILVDDGSTDGSGALCDNLAEADQRIRVIHKENGGICSARNAGMREAAGKYIAFCDNDDEYLPGLLRDNYDLAEKYEADFVRFCRAKTETRDGAVVAETVTGGFELQFIPKDRYPVCYADVKKTRTGVWAGLYRKFFLDENGIRFDESIRYGYEDRMFNQRCYLAGGSLVLNPGVYYRWFQRLERSTTGKYAQNVYDSIIKCLRTEERIISKYHIRSTIPGLWQEWLTREYIAELYDRLRPWIPGMDKKRVLSILRGFRKDTAFSVRTGRRELAYLWKSSYKNWLIWTMFRAGQLWPLYELLYGKRKLDNLISGFRSKNEQQRI